MNQPLTEVRLRLSLASFDLDLEFRSNARSLGIFGPSGGGKTSLLECLAGWRRPQSGRIRLGGRLLFDAEEKVSIPIEKRGTGYVPQDALLLPDWTVRKNILAGDGRPAGHPPDEALFNRTIAILELGELLERTCRKLSGGERQRVALARALVSQPSFLLLDEPLGSLDAHLRRKILPYLLRIQEAYSLPTIFVSHDPTEVLALCEDVVILESGRVASEGPASSTLRAYCSEHGSFENVLTGTVTALRGGTAVLALHDGGVAALPSSGLTLGDQVVFALGSDEILLALDPPARISARNVERGKVVDVQRMATGGLHVDLRLQDGSGAPLRASLTEGAASELGISPGVTAYLIFKANSCRVLSAIRQEAT